MPIDPKKLDEILSRFDRLPDSANVSAAVAAAHDGCSERNVRRNYSEGRVQLSPGRSAYNVGWIRNRGKPTAA
jgi:hypothetical protein